MGQNHLYYNEICTYLGQRNYTDFYPDPCNSRMYHRYVEDQHKTVNFSCNTGEIYNPETCVCSHPDDAICLPGSPWQRCNATGWRCNSTINMTEWCNKNMKPCDINRENSEKITDNVNLPIIQMVLPITIGIIILSVMIIVIMYLCKRQNNEDVSEPSEEEDPHYHSVRAGYQNDIVQETKIARGGNVLYDNHVGQHGSTACRLAVLSPVPSENQTELFEETTRNHGPGCRVFPTQLPVHDSHYPADIPLRLMNRENRGLTLDVSHSGSTMISASQSSVQVIHTQDQRTLSRPSCMSLEHCGSTSANSLVQSVNTQLGETARTDPSYLSVRGNASM